MIQLIAIQLDEGIALYKEDDHFYQIRPFYSADSILCVSEKIIPIIIGRGEYTIFSTEVSNMETLIKFIRDQYVDYRGGESELKMPSRELLDKFLSESKNPEIIKKIQEAKEKQNTTT